MEIRNGRMRPATVPATTPKKVGAADAASILTTKGVTVAYDAPTPRTTGWKCAGVDPELFFPTDEAGLVDARAFCAACPNRQVCLDLALARQESGVWGGVLLEMGKVLDQPRRTGRPKKNTNAGTAA